VFYAAADGQARVLGGGIIASTWAASAAGDRHRDLAAID